MARTRFRGVFIDGLDDVLDMFQDLTEAAEEGLNESAKKGSEVVLKSAKQKVRVRTGALRDSLDNKAEKSTKKTKKVWRVYSKGIRQGGVRYAFAVEAGTKKQPAKPFMRPATDDNMNRIKNAISEGILRALGRVI